MTDAQVEQKLYALGVKMRTYGLTADERRERHRLQNILGLRRFRTREQLIRARAKVAALERQAERYGLTC